MMLEILYSVIARPLLLATLLPLVSLAVILVPYFRDPRGLRSYPGPFLAQLTDLWLAHKVWVGNRSPEIHNQHKKYGPFLRIGPNHISIASPAALGIIYSHSHPMLKSEFYDGLATFSAPGTFTTRDRAVHARKRRIVAHLFAPKTVRLFEDAVQKYVGQLVNQWDGMCKNTETIVPGTVTAGKIGDIPWVVRDSRVWFNCMPWLNFLAFDTIGDLAFGSPFGMLVAGKDTARIAKSLQAAMQSLGNVSKPSERLSAYEEEDIPAISSINRRSEFLVAFATLPIWLRHLVRQLPFSSGGVAATREIMSMAATTASRRVRALYDGGDGEKRRPDFLTKLLECRDEDGKALDPKELAAEAQTLLIAGSDTLSNSTCATVYWVARSPDVQEKLYAELVAALADVTDGAVAPFDKIEHLPYLNAVIDEGLRVHSTVGANLPRVVGSEGVTILGHTFTEGTVISVPSYSAHRDPDVWGYDAELFRPERWLEADKEKRDEMNKAFVPFSVGPRACVGRNLAKMQLLINIATVFRLYDIVLENPDAPLPVHDNFIRKPLNCHVGVKRR
ncbi:cytochrome P450 monooxygenase pc-bph [Obba rivulosa]|uniref:Cytochrome P450 monooxygenase pc-bph n=1 Tax=Obba rivulosa TaxID=1052685 RepID=A0A8E2B4M8_9APHY|nr:cytochrome P450 monooxygenase pc-bph [Obba rivulosa]